MFARRLTKFLRDARGFLENPVDAAAAAWTTRRLRLAHRYLKNGNPEKALAIADDICIHPDLYIETQMFHRLASIYYSVNRRADTKLAFERTEERRREIARERQYDQLQLRFFPGGNIGHLGCLDRFIKAEILDIIPRRINVIIGDLANFANLAYVRYWEKYFSRITNRHTISLLAPLWLYLEERSTWTWCGGDFPALARKAQLKWEAEGRGPLLELSPEHRARGYFLLRELGVPESAWFVGLHVREGKDRSIRNVDITTYGLAVEEIARRGGWVLRLGDRHMSPLPSWPNSIDFAHSAQREDWMDVFVWAEGRFFISTSSGPQLIPTTFGKPVVMTNFGPLTNSLSAKDDILLPKQYWLDEEKRCLTMVERLSPDYALQESIDALAKLGVRVVDNTPEDLRDVVIEMMDRLERRYEDTEQGLAVQRRFAELAAAHNFYPARIARAFLLKYPELFGAQGEKIVTMTMS